VVIEEDGKTEEEFIEELSYIQTELDVLNKDTQALQKIISYNLRQLTGDA
jgi:type I restriction enzyme M protein